MTDDDVGRHPISISEILVKQLEGDRREILVAAGPQELIEQ